VAGTDLTILLAYGIATLLAVLATLGLWLSTRNRTPVDTHRLAEFERRWLLIVGAILVALLAATIWFTPYGKSTPTDAQIVTVDAEQFFWKITPSTVSMSRPVAFVTRSKDVNHGFGIFRGHTFIAQIQVLPDKESTLIHRFTKPGTYTVLCLEFCGVDHGAMRATFQVTK
jgi:cytochrome c oxidase subunit 2